MYILTSSLWICSSFNKGLGNLKGLTSCPVKKLNSWLFLFVCSKTFFLYSAVCLCHLTFLIFLSRRSHRNSSEGGFPSLKWSNYRFSGFEFKSTSDRYYKNNLALINKFLFFFLPEILSFHKIQQQNNVILQRAFCIASVRKQCNYLWKILK